jgi:RNA polymerase sigma-70 factor (ECF subfamily)
VNTNRFEHISDSELLEKFNADHNNEWLGILLQRYTLLLFGTCMKYLKNEEEAKDAVQQIFLKAITELQKYKVSYFKSWLYMIARNYCLMKLRDKNIFIPVEERIPEEDTSEEKMELANTAKTVSLLEASIPELNEEQKTCVTLFYLKKKSYIEIASVTGFSLLQVKSHIQNGKRNLKSLIEKKMKNK